MSLLLRLCLNSRVDGEILLDGEDVRAMSWGRLRAVQNIGLIMISHALAVLAATCDRLAIMYQGKLVEEGESRTLIRNPRHPHTQTLVAAFPTVGDPTSRYAPAT